MQFSTLFISFLAGATGALAAPAALEERQALPVCLGSGTAQCVATDVLGLVILDSQDPPQFPTSRQNFIDICAAIGQQARCCQLPILDQALICSEPQGA